MPERGQEAGTILVIGASRGLGLGLVQEYLRRGWQVIATVRDDAGAARLAEAADDLPGTLRIETLEVTSRTETEALRDRLAVESLDILFVNAGIAGDHEAPIRKIPADDFAHLMEVNALAPLHLIERCVDRVKPDGMIVAMSSDMASITLNSGGSWEGYRASKAALNSLLKSYSLRLPGAGRTVVAMSPGWVRTDMGGPAAGLDVATSVRGIADTLAARRGSGGFVFVDHLNRDRPF